MSLRTGLLNWAPAIMSVPITFLIGTKSLLQQQRIENRDKNRTETKWLWRKIGQIARSEYQSPSRYAKADYFDGTVTCHDTVCTFCHYHMDKVDYDLLFQIHAWTAQSNALAAALPRGLAPSFAAGAAQPRFPAQHFLEPARR